MHFPILIKRQEPPQQQPTEEPPAPARRFTEEDVVALAEVLYEERVRRGKVGPSGPQKFTPIVLDFGRRLCYSQIDVHGVKRRVQVQCPPP